MKKITLNDIPKIIPQIDVPCPNPECGKKITIDTKKCLNSSLLIECPHCHETINVKNNFNDFVKQLNDHGFFKA